LITQYRVLDGNPADERHVEPSLRHHQQTFGQAPKLYAGDRGFYSPNNLTLCQQAGVELISIPQRGGKKTPQRAAIEKSPAFKKGQRFRAGIEGRISVLFRGRGMKRCLTEGRQRFELFVGAAVLANNLLRIARRRLISRLETVIAPHGVDVSAGHAVWLLVSLCSRFFDTPTVIIATCRGSRQPPSPAFNRFATETS
jgi:hypothetical protein